MIRALLNKYRHVILYLFFGALTTAVNFAVYYPLYNIVGLSATFSDVIAWIVAVLVAFLTNKPLVFQSKDWSLNVVFPEFIKFVISRFGSGCVEILSIFVFVEVLNFDGNIVKLVISILVVLLNYILSRFLVFNQKNPRN